MPGFPPFLMLMRISRFKSEFKFHNFFKNVVPKNKIKIMNPTIVLNVHKINL
jgi:hypothetical protein